MKPLTLRLADDLSIPLEAISETFAILAVRGAGKSNTAAVFAEKMFEAGLPFVVVDPVGAWYGLRSSQDGTGPGFAIPIFGGKRGDVPLERTGGSLVADLVVDERLTCILDLSTFESEAAKKAFLLDFARRLYQRNEQPLHLFLEEADDYIPQRLIGGSEKAVEAQLLRAFENIVRRGRSRGLGMTMITQRSASLNKSVLTQAGTLIAMRTTAPQDRDAVAEWIRYNGQASEILSSLASLENGEAWVYSPQFLKTVRRVHFYRRSTFDSGATPKISKSAKPPATLAQINLGDIQARMTATIEKAKADDPRELRRRIAELEKEVARRVDPFQPMPSIDDWKDRVARWHKRTIGPGPATRAMARKLLEETAEFFTNPIPEEAADVLICVMNIAGRECWNLGEALEAKLKILEAPDRDQKRRDTDRPLIESRTEPKSPAMAAERRAEAVPPSRATSEPSPAIDGVTGPQKRILNVLASFAVIRLDQVDKATIAIFADQSPRSSGFANNLGALRSRGLIEYPSAGKVSITTAGHLIAETFDRPPTLEAYQEAWKERLSGPQRRMIEALIREYPSAIEREALAEESDQSPRSSGFANNLGFLRNSLGLIDYPSSGYVVATNRLFPEGL
ncbi:hera helicase [Caudoviricetes sp.]|nr:hera helicase [Caudoviricetes sp.]